MKNNKLQFFLLLVLALVVLFIGTFNANKDLKPLNDELVRVSNIENQIDNYYKEYPEDLTPRHITRGHFEDAERFNRDSFSLIDFVIPTAHAGYTMDELHDYSVYVEERKEGLEYMALCFPLKSDIIQGIIDRDQDKFQEMFDSFLADFMSSNVI